MIKFELSEKQQLAFHYLTDTVTGELVFGGGARGGKTYLGAFWVLAMATRAFPGSAWLVAREELKALKRTTLRTFFAVAKKLGLKRDTHYNFNAQDMVMNFSNGSVVFFAELKRIPSDPEFDRIGSYDLTGAWLDEAQEITKDAKDALQFRFTVLEGYKWNTVPKTFSTCNPAKNWIHQDFWKPLVKEKKKIEGMKFITSLYTDNPYIDHEKYKKNVLKTKNKVKIERLLHGNFEYDDDPSKLMEYDRILDLFTNKCDPVRKDGESLKNSDKYLVGDVARKGRDKMPIGYFEGLQLKKVRIIPPRIKSDTTQSAKFIIDWAEKLGVPRSNIILDEDGVGGGVVDIVKCKGFLNGGSPIQPKKAKHDDTQRVNFANLKTQCYFKLADYVNESKIGIDDISPQLKQDLIEELEQVKQADVDKDNKISLVKKEIVKENLGRSPDLSDMLMMRMYFEIQHKVVFMFQSL